MRTHTQVRRSKLAGCARLGACLVLALAAQACTDPASRYDDFVDRTDSMRSMDAGAIAQGDRFDWSGQYLLALATSLSADQPLLFVADASVSSDLTRIELRIQALTTDDDESPRMPIGDVIVLEDLPYEEDGTFAADLGEVTIPGRANPLTGAEIVASVQLMASAQGSDAGTDLVFCGQVTGMVTVPLRFDLAGSTFGAVRTDELQDAELLPECP